MADKFKGIYRNQSIRLSNWDYGWNGMYYVTICTGGRECYFGNVIKGKMFHSRLGNLAKKFWLEIPEHFEYVRLNEYIIMPNHVHGIVEINKKPNLDHCRCVINHAPTSPLINSNTKELELIIKKGGITRTNNPMLHENLSRIMRWYKGRTTFEIRKENPDYCWQSRFYDTIIHDDKSLKNIRNYIRANPNNWGKDKLNLKYRKA